MPRVWRSSQDDAEKAHRYYSHESALLERLPLSAASSDIKERFPIPKVTPGIRGARSLMLKLPSEERTASCFQRDIDGEKRWITLSAETMTTYYEDRVLHLVGKQRMEEWHAQCGLVDDVVGCALAFWHNIDGGRSLPDSIAAGLKSTLLGCFDAVYLLSYQSFDNVPPHVQWIDASDVCVCLLFAFYHRGPPQG